MAEIEIEKGMHYMVRSIEILVYIGLGTHGRTTVEIQRKFGISYATARRILKSMLLTGLVHQTSTRKPYLLGPLVDTLVEMQRGQRAAIFLPGGRR